jgi:hypothetical protein
MADVVEELLELKQQALDATQRADGTFYEGYLADDAVAITPYGVFDKAAIVAQMSSPQSSFKSDAIDDERAIELSPTSGVVSYRAIYGDRAVYVTTIYRRDSDGWKGLFYQQTPSN